MRRSNKWNKKNNKYSHLEIRFSNTGEQTHINTLQYNEQQFFYWQPIHKAAIVMKQTNLKNVILF